MTPSGNRYFPGDHPGLRALLDRYLAGMSERLAASQFARETAFLLLAGGYGRGEGGVFYGENGPALYNDLEFYLVLKTGTAREAAQRWCEQESHHGEEETGIEVEFKILPLAALRRAEPSMFYYDLAAANIPVFGCPNLPERLSDGARIPAHEAARLLFNRGSGLFYARLLLAEGGDRNFVERNHAKARLAFADAVLALNGRYDWSCRARHERLSEPLAQKPPNFSKLAVWHESAVDFKFHPRYENPPLNVLRERQEELLSAWNDLFLWLESIRLKHAFASGRDYAAYGGRLFPEFPALRNLALHLRDSLRRRKRPGGDWFDYPRAPLQRALALLLQPDVDLPRVCLLLSLPRGSSMEQIHEAYRRWWRFYN